MIPVACECSGLDASCSRCARRLQSFADLLSAEEWDQARELAVSSDGLVIYLFTAILNRELGRLPRPVAFVLQSIRIAPFYLKRGPARTIAVNGEPFRRSVTRIYLSETTSHFVFGDEPLLCLVELCIDRFQPYFPDDPYERARATPGLLIGDDP